jgi:acyl-coenzyme A thioesterase PaaI-like protein
MPVNASVHQPMGFHGGASVALAESVGSAAFSFINAKNKKYVELKYRQII